MGIPKAELRRITLTEKLIVLFPSLILAWSWGVRLGFPMMWSGERGPPPSGRSCLADDHELQGVPSQTATIAFDATQPKTLF